MNGSSLSEWYVAEFRTHQEFVQAHLKGTEQPLPPSFFPPSSYWTSHEKDLFFHGLAVYSRFRPDLIAESIKTKTTFDVCLYLDILQTASSRMIPSETHGSFRNSLEPAMEVSSTWIQREEKIAASLIQFDSCPWTPGAGESNNIDNRCVCSPQSGLVDEPSHTELKKSYLSHLDGTCLMALEKIIREAQIGEVDSAAAVPQSPALESLEQPATQTSSFVERGSDLNPPESPVTASQTPKPDSSKLAQYRLMKRLYMRRMRARSTGKSINMEAIRLRPGRQIKERKPSKPRPRSYKGRRKIAQFNSNRKESNGPEEIVDPDADHVVSAPDPVGEVDSEDETQYEPRSKGGLTSLYRTRSCFLKMGVDSQLASNNNLDFFDLSSLAQLMRLYGSLNNSSYETSISADTIQLLAAILHEFTSEVIRGSLVSKEQEIRMKSDLKVWKYDPKEITVENIKETLKYMGIAHSNLKDYLGQLVEESNDDVSSPDPATGEEMSTEDDDSEDDEDEDETSSEDTVVGPSNASDRSEQSPEPSQPLTEFWLPQSLRQCLLPKDFQLSENESDLLPEIDETELQRELKEEEELDARDLSVSKEFEAGLWGLRTTCETPSSDIESNEH